MKLIYEKVPRAADASFGLFRFSGKAFDAPYHMHPEFEITWIMEGRGELLVGDGLSRFEEGDVILQGGGLPHSYRSDAGGRARSCWVQFAPDAFGVGFWDLPECHRIRRLLARADRGLRFGTRVAKAATARLSDLDQATGPARIAGLISLLHELSQDRSPEPLASGGYARPRAERGLDRVERILDALEAGWREPLKLKQVAKKVGMHPQSLSRFCRRYLRRSFQSMLVERRLGEVARRLLGTDETVAEIAFACGFNNLANFNRLFLRAYDDTPRAYRRKAGPGSS